MTKRCSEYDDCAGSPETSDRGVAVAVYRHFHERLVLASAIALAVFGFVASGSADDEIVPIQFAELMDESAGPAEALELPSVMSNYDAVDGTETIISDVRIDDGALSTDIEGVRVPPPIVGVSARAADGLRVDDLCLDEMPYEASSGDWFSSGRWYGSAEMLWFNRSRNYRKVIAFDATRLAPTNNNNVLGTFTTTAIPFPIAPGARLTLGEYLGRDYLDRDQSLEMTYYGGLAFYQSDSWNALPGSFLITPLTKFNAYGFSGAQTYSTTHNSIFNSMEWNYKLHRRLGRDQLVMSPNGNWSRHAERAWLPALIMGTRVVNVNEVFTLTSRRTDVPPSEFGGNYNINTQNWLWGFNLGGELLSQNEFYHWGLRSRITPSMCFAGGQQNIYGTQQLPTTPSFPFSQGTVSRAVSNQQLVPGFIWDMTLFAGWNVTPNFSLKAGYDFLWVAGIATATRQFDLDNIKNKPLDGGGQIYYNGLSFGCEGSW